MKDSRVGVLDVRVVRAVQGRVHKLLDNLFLVAFFPMINDELPRGASLISRFPKRKELYLLNHFSC